MPNTERTGRASIGATPYSLSNDSTTLTPIDEVGIYCVMVDFSAMTLTETYELTILAKIDAAGSQLPVYNAFVVGTSAPVLLLPSLPLRRAWEVQVQKVAGTDRSIGWSITRLD